MATEPTKSIKEETKYVRLSEIKVDYDWNCRQGRWQDEPAPEEGKDAPAGSFWSLYQSLLANGQDDPVVVIPTGNDKQPYFLVAGFRRTAALTKIAENKIDVPRGGSSKDPLVLVQVRALSEGEAKALNLRENIERKGIRPVDTARIVWELSKENPDSKHKMVATEIAAKIGMGNSNTSQMVRIMGGLSKPVAERWKDEASLDVVSLDAWEKIAQKPKGEQNAEVEKVVKAKTEKKTNQWIETAKRESYALGQLFGHLHFKKHIDGDKLDFAKALEDFVGDGGKLKWGFLNIKGNKGSEGVATDAQKQHLVDSMTEGYNSTVDGPPPEEPKAEKPAKADKAANGKEATASA